MSALHTRCIFRGRNVISVHILNLSPDLLSNIYYVYFQSSMESRSDLTMSAIIHGDGVDRSIPKCLHGSHFTHHYVCYNIDFLSSPPCQRGARDS